MKTKRVLLDSQVAPLVDDLFRDAGMEIDTITPKKRVLRPLLEFGDYAALFVSNSVPIPYDLLEAAGKRLKVIGVFGDDVSNVDVADASRNGILVKVSEYGNTFEVASLTMRLMVMLMSRAFRRRDSGQALVVSEPGSMLLEDVTGFELAETVMGLIGCGNVAQLLAAEMGPHCKRIIGYDNNLRGVFENFHQRTPLEKPIIEYGQLLEVLENSDIISIHTAGDTKVFKGDELYFAKQRPFILNTARSGTVDEASLLSALEDKRIRGAAFTLPPDQLGKKDLPDWVRPFLKYENVVIAPSIGTPPADTERKQARKLARSIIGYLLEKDLSLAVNPMGVVSWQRKQQFPLYRGQNRAAVPIQWGR